MRNEAGQRLIEFCQENALVIANTLSRAPQPLESGRYSQLPAQRWGPVHREEGCPGWNNMPGQEAPRTHPAQRAPPPRIPGQARGAESPLQVPEAPTQPGHRLPAPTSAPPAALETRDGRGRPAAAGG